MRIKSRNVVITGASSGIGEALAHEVARRGGNLLLAARQLDRLESLACQLRSAGSVAHAVRCDVSRPADVQLMIRHAMTRLGGVDILVNNAGICAYGLSERTKGEDLLRLLAVNLMGPWYTTAAAVPVMRSQESGGVVVNVASVAALYGPPYLAAYAATKAGLAVMTQSQRAELAAEGIRMMVVYPGYTDTELFARERRLGGARRPRWPYASAVRVARAIVRGIELERRELVLSPEGHAISLLKRFVPRVLHGVMRLVAIRLSDPSEAHDVQAETSDHRPVPEPR